jgi:hypothetical protein
MHGTPPRYAASVPRMGCLTRFQTLRTSGSRKNSIAYEQGRAIPSLALYSDCIRLYSESVGKGKKTIRFLQFHAMMITFGGTTWRIFRPKR